MPYSCPCRVRNSSGRQPIVEAEVLRQKTDAGARRPVAQRRAQQGGAAGGGRDQAEQHLDRGGLAGAVGTQEAKDLTLLDLQGEALDGDVIAKDFAQLVGLDCVSRSVAADADQARSSAWMAGSRHVIGHIDGAGRIGAQAADGVDDAVLDPHQGVLRGIVGGRWIRVPVTPSTVTCW